MIFVSCHSNSGNGSKKEPILKPKTSLTASFMNKDGRLILIVNGKEFTVIKDYSELGGGAEADKKGALAVYSSYAGGGYGSYTATLEKNGDIKIEGSWVVRGGGELHASAEEVMRIKKGDYE